MSRGFLLRKLYADLVTDDGHVIVAYLGWLCVAGLRTRYAAVETYRPDGTRRVVRGLPPRHGPLPTDDGGYEYRITTRQGRSFRLMHHGPTQRWQPQPPISPTVRWHVRVPAAPATACWDDGPSLTGSGYSDWVELDRPPRWIGLTRLQWGRVHLPGRTVVFNTLDHSDGRRWSQIAEWDTNGPLLGSAEPRSRGGVLDIPAPTGTVTLTPQRVLHEGTPLDEDRFPNRIERWASRLANGPAYETRWLSAATPVNGQVGMALHESVHFTSSAR